MQVLEYMGGGDLLNLLIERDIFEEDFTRFYVAEASGLRSLCLCPASLTRPVMRPDVDGPGYRTMSQTRLYPP